MPATQTANKQLITDVITFEPQRQAIQEAVNENRPIVVKGVLQRAEARNQNGRIYPKDILEREVRKYEQNFINQRRAFGELDHPDSSVVSLKNVSHNVLSVEWNGNDLVGDVQILSTPSGNILKELFMSNVNVGISSRGLGSVTENRDGTLMVGDDFELIAWDFVSNPSTEGAFMNQINENVGRGNAKQRWKSVNNLLQEIIHNMSDEYKAEDQ